MKRRFTAAKDDDRCKADITTGWLGKEGAQCMRAAKKDGYCLQHHKRYGCSCPTECDCQNPEPEEGAALVSEECPIHNWNPQPSLSCSVHGEPKTA